MRVEPRKVKECHVGTKQTSVTLAWNSQEIFPGLQLKMNISVVPFTVCLRQSVVKGIKASFKTHFPPKLLGFEGTLNKKKWIGNKENYIAEFNFCLSCFKRMKVEEENSFFPIGKGICQQCFAGDVWKSGSGPVSVPEFYICSSSIHQNPSSFLSWSCFERFFGRGFWLILDEFTE